MRHKNSVFHGLLQHVPWGAFDKLVEQHNSDKGVRRLSTKDQFIALLYGQLSGAVSLREIECGLESHKARLYHLNTKPAKRSTLSDANALRPSAVFVDLFLRLVSKSSGKLRRTLADTTYLIDSTSIRLNELSAKWARFSEDACGAKVHMIHDVDADCPIYAVVTAANVNDITAAKQMPIEAGATYVFDLGYYDYGWWSKLDEAGCRIVTRFKSNTPLRKIEERDVGSSETILSDRVGFLPARQAKNRNNPFSEPIREVRVKINTGKILRILSNDLDASAQDIADLYKRRWQIELFFRWIKQNLKIKKFLGTSQNAIRIQIAVALIAYLLIRLVYHNNKITISLLSFTRLVRINLMHRRCIQNLLEIEPQEQINTDQMAFQCF